MILSFFPFVLFIFALLKLTPLTEKDFMEWVFSIVPQTFLPAMESFVEDIYQRGSQVIPITVISAVFLSSKAFISLQIGLNEMYEVDEHRGFIKLRVYAFLYSLAFAVLLIAVLGFLVFGEQVRGALFQGSGIISKIINLREAICVPVIFLFLLLIYRFVPDRKSYFTDQIPGAAFTTVAWLIFSEAFSLYVDHYSNYASFYGTLTTIALIMVWLYGCMYVLFLGGIINSFLGKKFKE